MSSSKNMHYFILKLFAGSDGGGGAFGSGCLFVVVVGFCCGGEGCGGCGGCGAVGRYGICHGCFVISLYLVAI